MTASAWVPEQGQSAVERLGESWIISRTFIGRRDGIERKRYWGRTGIWVEAKDVAATFDSMQSAEALPPTLPPIVEYRLHVVFGQLPPNPEPDPEILLEAKRIADDYLEPHERRLLAQRIGLLEQQRLRHAAANEWERASAILDEMQRLSERVEAWHEGQAAILQQELARAGWPPQPEPAEDTTVVVRDQIANQLSPSYRGMFLLLWEKETASEAELAAVRPSPHLDQSREAVRAAIKRMAAKVNAIHNTGFLVIVEPTGATLKKLT